MKQIVQRSSTIKALLKLKGHSLALVGLIILIMLYTVFIFAECIAPYHFDNESRRNSYNPPSKIHFFHQDGRFSFVPFVYNYHYEFNEYYKRIFTENSKQSYPIKLFVKGDSYKLWGFIPMDRHLFGVDSACRFYVLGADYRGRDIFSRIVYGSRVSLSIGFVGVFVSFLIAMLVGGMAGYYGGIIDTILMRFTEMIMIIPYAFLLLSLRAAFPPEISSMQVYILIIFIMSFIGWAPLARIIRGMTKSIREREFILAAVALGQKDSIIIFKHIIPQTFSYLIVAVTLSIPAYIIGESALSLLGLGIQDPYASWGNMLSDALNITDIQFHPWILLPGLFIFMTVISFNLLGDGLRDVFDTKSGRI